MREHMKVYTQQFDMRKYSGSKNLLSREQGQRIFEGIKDELKKLPSGGILFLDFRNIRYATHSCLIEMLSVIKEFKQREFQDKYLILKLESTNLDLKDTLFLVLKENRIVIPSLDEKDNWEILGELTKAQRDTLEILRERGEVTSTEISTLLDIPINAASNRLKDLYDMKLATRDESILPSTGGIQFVYRCMFDRG